MCYILTTRHIGTFTQKKLSARHAKWLEFLEEYSSVLKHCAGLENKFADALSRDSSLQKSMGVHVVGFERMKNEYSACPDCGFTYHDVLDGNHH